MIFAAGFVTGVVCALFVAALALAPFDDQITKDDDGIDRTPKN